MNSVTMKSPISELERFTRLRIRSGVTGAKTALAPQYLRKLRKGLNLNYFGKKTVKKEPFQNYLVKKTPEARAWTRSKNISVFGIESVKKCAFVKVNKLRINVYIESIAEP